MSETRPDATHPASPIQLEQARQRGDRTFSSELGTAIQLLGGLGVMLLCLNGLATWAQTWTADFWGAGGLEATELPNRIQQMLWSLAGQLTPMLLLLAGLAVAGRWLQTGIDLQTKRVRPDLSRLAPLRPRDRTWAMRLWGGLLAFPKMLSALGLGGLLIWLRRDAFFELALLPPDRMTQQGLGLILGICFQVALILLAAGLLDYGLAWVSRRQRLQMSDQELRDELRMQEGDPTVARRRQAQRDAWREQAQDEPT